jgi:ADP-heptose:LPS heptosyltransferase
MVRFLIIRFSSIGDVVLTTPVIRCLKEQVEGAEIHYLTKPAFAGLLQSSPYIEKVLTLKEKFHETMEEIIEGKYDYIIDLHHNLRSYRIKKQSGLLSFSFPKLNFEKWLLVNFKIDRMPDKHIVDRYFETVSIFDVKNDGRGLDYFIPEGEEINPDDFSPAIENGFVAFVTGAKHNTKKIPVTLAVSVLDQIIHPVFLLGDRNDAVFADEIIKQSSNKKLVNLCGKTSLHGSASLIRQSAVVVTGDTGLMHIAAAFHKPIVSVWGNTVPEFGMFPYTNAENSVLFEVKGLRCRPCSKIGFEQCPKKHFHCMEKQSAVAIAGAIQSFLKKNHESN